MYVCEPPPYYIAPSTVIVAIVFLPSIGSPLLTTTRLVSYTMIIDLGPLHTRAKSRDREIVKKVSKGRLKIM